MSVSVSWYRLLLADGGAQRYFGASEYQLLCLWFCILISSFLLVSLYVPKLIEAVLILDLGFTLINFRLSVY